MSIDKSLISKSKLVRQRNVLTRPERIKHLQDEGLWDEKKSVYGLPKVKIVKIKKKVKVKKAVEVAEGAGAGEGAGDGDKGIS
ncbi:MAG: small basic protein [Candidatus Scalindua sp.]|nr:small basic protein [Candidatus Scalindua sp.]